MKKKRNKPQKRSKAKSAPGASERNPDRRSFLARSGKWMIGVALLGGGAGFAISAVRATAREQDLSRVGQGVPSVVQIHDPGCALCTALQKEARRAMKGIDPATLTYVVANLKTDEGRDFANRHRQPHVTLMLLDPGGTPVQVLNGPQDADDLRALFRAHVAAYR
ncbi:MAG: hypothetical protein AAF280_09700 [Pseudomonadota bacterium]